MKTWPQATCIGIWSTVEALNGERLPNAPRNAEMLAPDIVCAFGLPRYTPTASRPCASTTRRAPAATASNASSQPT
jgi:hypothetical protein